MLLLQKMIKYAFICLMHISSSLVISLSDIGLNLKNSYLGFIRTDFDVITYESYIANSPVHYQLFSVNFLDSIIILFQLYEFYA